MKSIRYSDLTQPCTYFSFYQFSYKICGPGRITSSGCLFVSLVEDLQFYRSWDLSAHGKRGQFAVTFRSHVLPHKSTKSVLIDQRLYVSSRQAFYCGVLQNCLFLLAGVRLYHHCLLCWHPGL